MARLLRLLTLFRVGLRYRLDTFFQDDRLPPLARLIRIPSALLPQPRTPRGERLRLALEDLGPVYIKFGQLLSTRPDLIPPDVCDQLGRLQDDVPPFDSGEFTAIVEKNLGGKVAELFSHFDSEPLASASVAQVHAAVLQDGREVVVKAIRPGIARVIHTDLDLLFILARWIERISPLGRRLRPVEVVTDYRNTILDELDLKREGANTSLLRHNFADSALLYVPEVHWPLTNEKVLVMERIYALPVTDLAELRRRGTDFRVLAERGVEIFFTQVFEHNFFHADMHPGNIFVDASNPRLPRYLAVDCAVIGSLSDEDRYYLARNLLAIFRRDYRQVAELHVLSGWVPVDTPVNEFEATIRTVCEPVFERPLREISFAQILVSLFRTAQRFDMEVQPSLVLLQKTLINVEGLGRQLYPDLDLWATAHPFLEKWLQDRVSPGAVVKTLKRHGPEWLEQFPKVPQLVYQSLDQMRRLDDSLARANRPAPPRRWRPAGGCLLVGAGAGLAAGEWNTTPLEPSSLAVGLMLAGALLLLLR